MDGPSTSGARRNSLGQCAACYKPVHGQVIQAMGRAWHPEHFRCHACQDELGTQRFHEHAGHPYCERDFQAKFSNVCAACDGRILDKTITALGKSWHPEHFVCTKCRQPFGDDGFHEEGGMPYCVKDYYELVAPKCAACREPLMGEYTTAICTNWHHSCFVCQVCKKPFNTDSYFEYNGMPYCEKHYHDRRGSVCYNCKKPITDRCINALGHKFHPEHFVCAKCKKVLKGQFQENGGKPYCEYCHMKLYRY